MLKRMEKKKWLEFNNFAQNAQNSSNDFCMTSLGINWRWYSATIVGLFVQMVSAQLKPLQFVQFLAAQLFCNTLVLCNIMRLRISSNCCSIIWGLFDIVCLNIRYWKFYTDFIEISEPFYLGAKIY